VNSECDEAPTRPASAEQPSHLNQNKIIPLRLFFLIPLSPFDYLLPSHRARTHTPRGDKSQRHKKTLILWLSFHWGRISSRDLGDVLPQEFVFHSVRRAAGKRRKVNLDNLLPTSQNSQAAWPDLGPKFMGSRFYLASSKNILSYRDTFLHSCSAWLS
jgi:hypothetical protein